MYDLPHDGALHTADLGTVFGTQSMIANTIVPEAVTQIVQQAWVSFAQTGTPTVYGVEWPVVHANKPMQALVLGEQVKVVSFESKACNQWVRALRHIGGFNTSSMCAGLDHDVN